MRGALGGPRVLLRRLREVMAEPVSAQDRLDKVVVLIAANMVAEVCSVYVLRVDGTLELYATEGLKREAVHQTVLKADEGLVGLVASEANPINLSDAQAHPAFSFRPETGEEIYHSFLGVPILRAGNTLGVLVVQNRARRTYTEEEEEALQTTAMVLAEMIASASCPRSRGPAPNRSRATPCIDRHLAVGRHRARPRGAARAARGHYRCHRRRRAAANSSGSTPPSPPCAPISTGWSSTATSPTAASIATCSKPTACSPTTRAGCTRSGKRSMTGLTAEAGVERVQSDTRARMLRASDPYLRERLHDLDDLANRLMRVLMGQDHAPTQGAAAGKRDRRGALHGTRGAARLRSQAAARPRAGGRRADLARLDRGARARHSDGGRNRQCHRPGRDGRRHHRRRLHRRRAHAAAAGHRGILWRAGEVARPPAGAISRAARAALRHQGRPENCADDQCRPDHRPSAYRGYRRRRHRPVPDRIAVHGGAIRCRVPASSLRSIVPCSTLPEKNR